MVLILNCDICPLGFGEITWIALFYCRNSEREEDVISPSGLERSARPGVLVVLEDFKLTSLLFSGRS
jgi:hypothetical protein